MLTCATHECFFHKLHIRVQASATADNAIIKSFDNGLHGCLKRIYSKFEFMSHIFCKCEK